MIYMHTYIHAYVHICMSYILSVHIQATMRTWKQYYTVLSGPELCFYKDRKDFQQVITTLLSCYVAIYHTCITIFGFICTDYF